MSMFPIIADAAYSRPAESPTASSSTSGHCRSSSLSPVGVRLQSPNSPLAPAIVKSPEACVSRPPATGSLPPLTNAAMDRHAKAPLQRIHRHDVESRDSSPVWGNSSAIPTRPQSRDAFDTPASGSVSRGITPMAGPYSNGANSPLTEQLKIMRLVKVGQSHSNRNVKLTRLAAMMDQHKLREFDLRPTHHLSDDGSPRQQPFASRPQSGASTLVHHMGSSTTSYMEQAPMSTFGSPRLEDRVASSSTGSALGSPSKSTEAPGLPASSGRRLQPIVPTFTDRLHELMKEEDYWRGYRELEEQQRRYYILTFFRRGETPFSNPMFDVDNSENRGDHHHHQWSARPMSAASSHVATKLPELRVRPSTALSQNSSPASGAQSGLRSVLAQQQQQHASSAKPTIGVSVPCAAPPCHPAPDVAPSLQIHEAADVEMNHSSFVAAGNSETLHPLQQLSETTSPTANATSRSSLLSPQRRPEATLLREYRLKCDEELDEVMEDESFERNRLESRLEAVLWPQALKFRLLLLPHLETVQRDIIQQKQRDLFFETVNGMSAYLKQSEEIFQIGLLIHQQCFDASVATVLRHQEERSHLETLAEESMASVALEEHFIFRTLLRRWHQHFQIMLLRWTTYTQGMSTLHALSSLSAVELQHRATVVREEALQRGHLRWYHTVHAETIDDATSLVQAQVQAYSAAVSTVTKWRKHWDSIQQQILLANHEHDRRRGLIEYQENREFQSLMAFHGDAVAVGQRGAALIATLEELVAEQHDTALLYYSPLERALLHDIEFNIKVLNPEKRSRRAIEADELTLHQGHAIVDTAARQCQAQWKYMVSLVNLEYQSSERLFEEMTRILHDEAHEREKILDLEEEAYEDDFIISHQRMRRLDTVRSFIIASPAQERRSRLALEAEYREGLYTLMELNDDALTIMRIAHATFQSMEHMFLAHKHMIEWDIIIVQPETAERFAIDAQRDRELPDHRRLLHCLATMEATSAALLLEHRSLIEKWLDQMTGAIDGMMITLDEQAEARQQITHEETQDWIVLTAVAAQHSLHTEEVVVRRSLVQEAATERAPAEACITLLLRQVRLCASYVSWMAAITAQECLRCSEQWHRIEHMFPEETISRTMLQRIEGLFAEHVRNFLRFRAAVNKYYDEEFTRIKLAKKIRWQIILPEGVTREVSESKESAIRTAMQQLMHHLCHLIRMFEHTFRLASVYFRETVNPVEFFLLASVQEGHEREQFARLERVVREAWTTAFMWSQRIMLPRSLRSMELTLASKETVLVEAIEGIMQRIPRFEESAREATMSLEAEVRHVAIRDFADWTKGLTFAWKSIDDHIRLLQRVWVDLLSGIRSLHGTEHEAREQIQSDASKERSFLEQLGSRMLRMARELESAFVNHVDVLYTAASRSVVSLMDTVTASHPTELAVKVLYLLEDSDLEPNGTIVDFSWFDGRRKCTDDTLQLLDTLVEKARNTRWTTLILSNNVFIRRNDPSIVSPLAGFTNLSFPIVGRWVVSRLTRLDLKNCGFVDADLQPHFTRYLTEPDAVLESLALDDNDFTAGFCKDMYLILRDSQRLSQCTLSGNPQISKGMLQVLQYYCQLNRIGSPLKEEILEIEANIPEMRSWSCPYVPLDDEAVKLICVALFQNTHITTVTLAGHQGITDAACVSIASMLRGNATVGSLDLSGTRISDVGLLQIEHVIRTQPYRQPLIYHNLFVAASPSHMLRRRSSRSLRMQSQQLEMAEQGGFMMTIHHTLVSEKKYLQCVFAMNQIERAWTEVDEDEVFELVVAAFVSIRIIVELFEEHRREVEDAYDADEALRNKYFIDRVFGGFETKHRQHLEGTESRLRQVCTSAEALMRHMELWWIDHVQRAQHLFSTSLHVASTAWRIQNWTPSSKDRDEITRLVEVPEMQNRQRLETDYMDITLRTVDRYQKYVHGSEKYFQKIIAAKEALYDKLFNMYRMRRQSSFSLDQMQSLMAGQEPEFVPDELDAKQHQALAHLTTQPWELQGKGLAIAQNDPSAVVLDMSFAGVANKEEPPCTQDTIAILYTLAKNNTRLQSVNIAGCKGAVTGKCAPLLAKLMVKLQHLNVADCEWEEEKVVPHLLGAIALPTCRLETLVLDGNSMSPQTATQLCRALRSNVSLQNISLQKISPPLPRVSADFIQFYTDVNKLAMPYRTLIRRLESNDTSCVEADFTFAAGIKNAVGIASAKANMDATSMEVLDGEGLDGRQAPTTVTSHGVVAGPLGEPGPLDDRSVKLICIALTRNMTLERLVLAGNQITDRGLKFLSHILQSSPSLRVVDLSCNIFTDAGAKVLVGVAEKNSRLTDIKISSNDGIVSIQTRRQLQAQLQKNRTL